MVAQAGIEELQIPDFLPGEGVLALGSLVQLTHTVESGRQDEQDSQKDEYVFQGFLVAARPTIHTEIYTDALTGKKKFVKTPSVIYGLGEVMLIACNEEPVFQPQPDRILYSTDPAYDIEVMPTISGIPEQHK